jgi:hypothetical protein
MQARTLFLCAIFVVAQLAIFFVVKRNPSFAEAKWLLVYLEALVVLLTTGLYLGTRPSGKKIEAPAPVVVKEIPSQVPALQQKIAELQQTIQRLEEASLFSKQHAEGLKEEKSALEKKHQTVNLKLEEVNETVQACCDSIRELGGDFERVISQLEHERKQHAIEVRALLGKNYSPSREEKKVVKIALSPLPCALMLLLSCQKALEHGPSEEATAAFSRRKCFDIARQFGTSSVALISLQNPTEYFLSPKLSQLVSLEDLLSVIETHKESFENLQTFQPYLFSDKKIGEDRWTAFRLSHPHVNDLVVVVPHT